MFNDIEKLAHYSPFKLTSGMILLEMMIEKKIGYSEVFSILGSKSSVNEIINGKQSLKNSQIKELSKLFEVNEEVFLVDEMNFQSTNINPDFKEHSSYNHDDNSVNNHYNEMQSNDEFSNFENNSNKEDANQMKPFWED